MIGSRKAAVLLRVVVVLLVVGGAGLAWAATQPSTATACTLGLPVDQVGAATAGDARVALDLGGIDVDRPDELRESGDRSTAIYLLDGPSHGLADPTRSYFRQVVAERGADGLWRVVDANRCERWSE